MKESRFERSEIIGLTVIIAGCLLLSALSFSPAYGQTESYAWGNTAVGGGGFVTGIITSKLQKDLIYIRTDVGGAYRWDAPANRWLPLLDWVSENQTGYLGIESIAADPTDPAKVYMLAGTSYFNNGATAILRSADYGKTFSITDVSAQFKANGNGMGRQSGEKLAIDPNNTATLYCGTRANGLFKSSDSGVTWNAVTSLSVPVTPDTNGISFVLFDPSTGNSQTNTQTFIVGISKTGSGNLFKTEDGGSSFSAIASAPSSLIPQRAVLSADRNIYVTYANAAGPWDITGAGQIWKYDLVGDVWANVTPKSFGGAFSGISVDPENPQRLIASSLNTYAQQYGNAFGDRIFLSNDAGETWTDVIARGFKLDDQGISWINGNAIHWAGALAFDPFDTRKAWVGSGNGIFKTDNIDSVVNVWKFKVNGLEETVPQDIQSIANGPLASAIGDYDGFLQDNVSQYATINTPAMGSTSSITFASLEPNIGLRVGAKMYYTSDMGKTWLLRPINGTAGNIAISADGKTLLHCPSGSPITYRSTDAAKTWLPVNALNITDARPVADAVNPDKFYIYNASTGTVRVSNNNALSFSSAGNAGNGGSKIIRIVPAHEGDIWVALLANGLTRSTDSGKTFTPISGVTSCEAVGLGKGVNSTSYPSIFIWGTVNGILGIHRSTDEGKSWIRINDDAHQYGGPANGQFIAGDWNVFGRVYMSTAGRGIVYGESSLSCKPDKILPGIYVNKDALSQDTQKNLTPGDSLTLDPQPKDKDGKWNWTGPNGFTAQARTVIINKINSTDAGMYSVMFTNTAGCASAPELFSIAVAVKTQSVVVNSLSNRDSITQRGGSLQLAALVSPVPGAVSWSISQNPQLATISSSGLLTANADGSVTVRATSTDGSGTFGELVVIILQQDIATGLILENKILSIYPNPSRGSFAIILPAQQSAARLEIINVLGTLVWKKDMMDVNNIVQVEANLFPGLYVARVYDGAGGVSACKIIIQ